MNKLIQYGATIIILNSSPPLPFPPPFCLFTDSLDFFLHLLLNACNLTRVLLLLLLHGLPQLGIFRLNILINTRCC